MDQCPKCKNLVSISEEDMDFTDGMNDSVLSITIEATWCDTCGWKRIDII